MRAANRVALVWLAAVGDLWGQQPETLPSRGTAVVPADQSLQRHGVLRWLFGPTYRDLWETPLRVPILDLDRFAGGLTPLETGGGMQTRSLRFEGTDGRQYQFRLVAKDPQVEDTAYDGALVRKVLRDQISANHPGAGLVLPPFMEAAGILHAPPSLFLLPDHPRLGEFRGEFANTLGTIEERPTEGNGEAEPFAGASRIASTPKMLESFREQPWIRVDSRVFLSLRLIDLVVGDWDRHEDQYRWALVGKESQAGWLPIPRDRDQAFARFDGQLLAVARWFSPKLLNYDESYPSPEAATSNGKHLDRRILSDLEWPVWDSVTTSVVALLTDALIDTAIGRLPAEYRTRNGPTLRRVLRARRDALPEAAHRFYHYVSKQVLIHGGDSADVLNVIRHPDGRTAIQLRQAGKAGFYFQRTLHPKETAEIRVFLQGGTDSARIEGEGTGPLLRVIGGDGSDALINLAPSRGIRFYDSDDDTEARGAPLDRKPYLAAADTNPEVLPPEDWGDRSITLPRIRISSYSGLAVGVMYHRTGYGFRREPYASQHTIGLDYSFKRTNVRFETEARWRRVNQHTYFGFRALLSGIEGGRFFGLGSEASDSFGSTRSAALRKAYEISPFVGFGLESRSRLWILLRASHTITDPDDPDNRIAAVGLLRPPGTGDVGLLGPALRYELDTRDARVNAGSGVLLQIDGEYYPLNWAHQAGTFGALEGSAATYLPVLPSHRLTLALRAGGRRVWGEFPYFRAAMLGGSHSLRGYQKNRFAGDRSLFGNADLRFRLGRNRSIVPADIGLLGLVDAGQVWYGDTSSGWRSNIGGGIWISAIHGTQGLAFGLARGDEGLRTWLTFGTPF